MAPGRKATRKQPDPTSGFLPGRMGHAAARVCGRGEGNFTGAH